MGKLKEIKAPQTEMQTFITGYKVTDKDLKCRNYQYEIGKQFSHAGKIELCSGGFHFCLHANNCFNYYDFNPENRVFEVHAMGEVLNGDDKSVCSEITFIREVQWDEVLRLVNIGKNNTGRGNTGDSNSGDRNSGDSNSGDRNSGDRNSGDRNSGDRNSGDRNSGNWNSGDRNSGDSNSGYRNSGDSNSGYRNSGNWNSGDRNSGDRNSGNWNSGDRNSGDSNSGNWNSGDRNSGDRNSGDSNSGNWNSGDSNSGYSNSGDSNSGYRNSGNWNSGNWNSGDRNSGDSNSGYRNSGAFCTEPNPTIMLFDKPTNIKVKDWENHVAVQLMNQIDPTIWVGSHIMSDAEKANHPKYETTEGYLKTITIHEAWANAWGNWTDETKAVFLNLPNFDAKKFKDITGIKVK